MESRPSFRVPLWGQVVLLMLIVGGVFWPVHDFEFLRWDDDIAVTQNELITGELNATRVGSWFKSDQALRFKPVHWLSGWMLFRQFGLSPTAWHAFNWFLHVVVAAGFFLVLRQELTRWVAGGSKGAASLVAWIMALLWALHPLRVEPVAWVTASTYPMATGWLLLSFACYLRAHPSNGKGKPMGYLAAAWLTAVLAYGTYPITVTYGLFLVVIDVGLLRCVPRWGTTDFWRWTVKIGAFLLPAGAALGATVWARYFEVGIFSEAPDLNHLGVGERLLTSLALAGALAGKLFWFADLTPNVPPMDLTVTSLMALMGLAVTVVIASVWAWCFRLRSPGMAIVWFGFLLLALPCLGLTERATWPVDRYTYLSHMVLIAGIGGMFTWTMVNRPSFARGGVIAMMVGAVFFAVVSSRQLGMWRDSTSFFTALTTHPSFGQNVRQDGHVLLLWSRYVAEQEDEEEMNQLRGRALQVYLDGIRSALELADYAEAVSVMSHIQHHFTPTAEMYREQAVWLMELGRFAEAVQALEMSLELKPTDERALDLLVKAQAGRSGSL